MLISLLIEPEPTGQDLKDYVTLVKAKLLVYTCQQAAARVIFWLAALGGTAAVVYYLPSLTKRSPFTADDFLVGSALCLITLVFVRRSFLKLLPFKQKQTFHAALIDPRPPVLYLRSNEQEWRSARALRGHEQTFEERVAGVLREIGPVVAVGYPGELAPPFGAARLSIREGDWQNKVRRLMDTSRLVFLSMGRSEGVVWEIATALRELPPEKLIISFPFTGEDRFTQYFAARDAVNFRMDSILRSSLPRVLPDDALFLCFDHDWTPRFITSWKLFLTRESRTAVGWFFSAAPSALTLRKALAPVLRRYGQSTRLGLAYARRLLLFALLPAYFLLFQKLFLYFHPEMTHLAAPAVLLPLVTFAGVAAIIYALNFLCVKFIYARMMRGQPQRMESDVRFLDTQAEFIHIIVAWKTSLGYYFEKDIAPYYEGPVGDFSAGSIPHEWRSTAEARLLNPDAPEFLSRLERFSANVLAAGEDAGESAEDAKAREELAEHFRAIVSKSYDLISLGGPGAHAADYPHIAELYHKWSK